MRVALYARVSTSDQTCELQLRELRQYCQARGWTEVTEYVDTGWSGAKASRPALDRLMADASARRLDVVLVWKLDRWGRSIADSLRSIQALTATGVRWVSITQNLDTDQSNPMARFMLHIMAAFAELERELIRERITAGVRNARAKGTRLGRPRAVVDRQRIADLRLQGLSVRAIADELGVSSATIGRLVQRS